MIRKPNYHFDTKTDTGLDKIPVGSVVVVNNYNGKPRNFIRNPSAEITTSDTVEGLVNAGILSDSYELADPNILKSSDVGSLLQEPLISGTNIKTVSGQSLIGSGDISINVSVPNKSKYFKNIASDYFSVI